MQLKKEKMNKKMAFEINQKPFFLFFKCLKEANCLSLAPMEVVSPDLEKQGFCRSFC